MRDRRDDQPAGILEADDPGGSGQYARAQFENALGSTQGFRQL